MADLERTLSIIDESKGYLLLRGGRAANPRELQQDQDDIKAGNNTLSQLKTNSQTVSSLYELAFMSEVVAAIRGGDDISVAPWSNIRRVNGDGREDELCWRYGIDFYLDVNDKPVLDRFRIGYRAIWQSNSSVKLDVGFQDGYLDRLDFWYEWWGSRSDNHINNTRRVINAVWKSCPYINRMRGWFHNKNGWIGERDLSELRTGIRLSDPLSLEVRIKTDGNFFWDYPTNLLAYQFSKRDSCFYTRLSQKHHALFVKRGLPPKEQISPEEYFGIYIDHLKMIPTQIGGENVDRSVEDLLQSYLADQAALIEEGDSDSLQPLAIPKEDV